MARSRNIKPGFFKNEELASFPAMTRLLFAGLWTLADKAGRLEDRPRRIKAELFPFDDIATEDVEAMLSELSRGSTPFIKRYSHESTRLIQVVNWERHQSPYHREKESELPPPECLVPDKARAEPGQGREPARKRCNQESGIRNQGSISNSTHTSSKTPPPSAAGGVRRSRAWKGVEEDLLKCGVNAAVKAVDAAIANGCQPADVIATIAFWNCSRGKWQAGALYQRILNLRPDQDYAENWPPPCEEYIAAEAREKSARGQVDRTAQRESAQKSKAADDEKLAELEAAHGQKIDAMSVESIRELVRHSFPSEADVLLKQIKNGRPSRLLREMLLPLFSETREAVDLLSEAP